MSVEVFYDDLALANEVAGSDPLLKLIGKPRAAMKSLLGTPQRKYSNLLVYEIGPPGGGELVLFGDKTILKIKVRW